MQCLNEDNTCKGEVSVVENPITFRRFWMCDKHAQEYYSEMSRIQNEYPEVMNPCPDCGSMECIC